jgi:hypothetical protein
MSVSIGFSTKRGSFLSSIIRWATGSKVSHIWILSDIFGVPCVVEASEKGFFPSSSLARFEKDNEVVFLFPVEHDLSEGLRWAANHFGERYDFAGLFGMIRVLLGRLFHRRWKNPWNNRKALFCAEAIAEVLKRSAYPKSEALRPADVGPEDIRKFLSE